MPRSVAALCCLLLTATPALAAEDAIKRLDGLDGEFALYVDVPSVTPELAVALVRAKARGVHMGVMVPYRAARSPAVAVLRDAGIRVTLTQDVPEATIDYDGNWVAEGPDAGHMKVRRDPDAATRFALEHLKKLMAELGKQRRI